MNGPASELELRLAQFVEHHVLHGERLPLDALCADRPDLDAPLRALVDRYLSLTTSLDGGCAAGATSAAASAPGPALPQFDGFQTIERLGAGGMGEVFKLKDLRLGRIVAAKVVRRVPAGGAHHAGLTIGGAGLKAGATIGGDGLDAGLRASATSGGDGLQAGLNAIAMSAAVPRAGAAAAPEAGWTAATAGFLREARALALFSDRRIVQIFELRPDADPPVIIMEFVDGFELGQIGRSLELAQRARILIEICEAVHHAHTLGLQHRDLKPSNIMLDAQLSPRILDFGLSAADPARGHLQGTLPYVAPEQLDRSQPIDARTDVYALGVILYELLCGSPPYTGTDAALLERIREGRPPLPIEVDATVPEPLQAIALTAMEARADARYQTALDMAADLRRFLDGRPVQARPSLYASTLGARVAPHLDHVGEWLRLRLIYPHEADRLHAAYRALEAREDDWIVQSRSLSYTQIALYVGAFLLVAGSLFYFAAARGYEAVEGVARPFAVLGIPFVGLNAAAHLLYRKDHKAVAVAFSLAAVALLPLFLLILFHETGLLVVVPGTPGQLFQGGSASNHQLQVTTLVACAWCGWLALRTRTTALSTVFTVLALLLAIAITADVGLRGWLDADRWDLVALHLFPLVGVYAVLGAAAERTGRPWLSHPAYVGGAVLLVILLELLALDGRAFRYLGISLRPFQSGSVSDPLLLDTLAAMTLNGIIFYGAAAWLNRSGPIGARGPEVAGYRIGSSAPGIPDVTARRLTAQLLFSLAPFALLQPLGYLVRTGEYARRFDWMYGAFACAIILLSQRRQRRSFYYAGLLNLGGALYLVADHRAWFGRPAWGITLVAAGIVALLAGFGLDRAERRRC